MWWKGVPWSKNRIEQSCGPVITNPWSCSAEQGGQSTLEGTLEGILEDTLEGTLEEVFPVVLEDVL